MRIFEFFQGIEMVSKHNIDKGMQIRMLETMYKIRIFEEKTKSLFKQNLIFAYNLLNSCLEKHRTHARLLKAPCDDMYKHILDVGKSSTSCICYHDFSVYINMHIA